MGKTKIILTVDSYEKSNLIANLLLATTFTLLFIGEVYLAVGFGPETDPQLMGFVFTALIWTGVPTVIYLYKFFDASMVYFFNSNTLIQKLLVALLLMAGWYLYVLIIW